MQTNGAETQKGGQTCRGSQGLASVPDISFETYQRSEVARNRISSEFDPLCLLWVGEQATWASYYLADWFMLLEMTLEITRIEWSVEIKQDWLPASGMVVLTVPKSPQKPLFRSAYAEQEMGPGVERRMRYFVTGTRQDSGGVCRSYALVLTCRQTTWHWGSTLHSS